METLEHYLTNEFPSDKQDLARLEEVIQEVSSTLARKFDPEEGWPYTVEYQAKETPPPKAKSGPKPGLSHSTTAMVALSLWKLLDEWKRLEAIAAGPQFPPIRISKKTRKQIADAAETATLLLAQAITTKDTATTRSRTYGKEDPITLSFLAELLCLRKKRSDWASVRHYVTRRAEELKERDFKDSFQKLFFKRWKKEAPEAAENAIVPLRVVQAMRIVKDGREQAIPEYHAYFETKLHDQLSFSSIPDSRFDPAELAFCLEGLLLSQRNSVDEVLFRRVLDVMTKAQEESAFWRPTKPFMTTHTGLALFPISVEVANSLLRSCEIYDQTDLHDAFGSASIGLFRRYWKWLHARTVRFREPGDNGEEVVGWHSEHVNVRGVIHIWETSQVLEFLLAYHRALQAHIARKTLILSRFSIREPDLKNSKWKSEEVVDQKTQQPEIDAKTQKPRKIPGTEDKFEPATFLGPHYQVYRRIYNDFLADRAKGEEEPKYFSMLLYGPPGTGKTTVAENIADALGVRMITITVSDFLAGGEAEVESRAKAIFDVLTAQSNCVVLFDEIDAFLLDRESTRYRKQDTVFQFITPGMLTKINDLRRAKRVLFVIGTNYENRIDGAIKRTGRIDRHYLVPPMDGAARERTLKKLIEDREFAALDVDSINEGWVSLREHSLNLSYKDMEGAVLDVPKDVADVVAELDSTLKLRSPTTSLRSYQHLNRKDPFQDSWDRELDWEEFLCVFALAWESEWQQASIIIEGKGTHSLVLRWSQALEHAFKELAHNPQKKNIADLLVALGLGIFSPKEQ